MRCTIGNGCIVLVTNGCDNYPIIVIRNPSGGGILSNPLLEKLGEASFEMYMMHAIIIALFQHGIDKYLQGGIVMQIIAVISCLIFSILVGMLFHNINGRIIKLIHL